MKARKITARILAIAGILTLAGTARASSTFVGTDNIGTPLGVFGITGFTITGADMVGLRVTVTYSDSSTSTAFWTSLGGTSGQATGASPNDPTHTWILSQTGDTGAVAGPTVDGTAKNQWTLTNNSTALAISSISLLGGVVTNGNIVFDRNESSANVALVGVQNGTPGSSFGVTFSNVGNPTVPFTDSGNFTATGTYFNSVFFLGGSPPACQGAGFSPKTTASPGCGDTWQGLSIAFTGTSFIATVGGAATFNFFQDTDQVALPEPVSIALVGAGLLGMGLYRRRRAN